VPIKLLKNGIDGNPVNIRFDKLSCH